MAALEWRFRGPRFNMDWRHASSDALERTTLSDTFDLSRPPGDDDQIERDQIGLEIRFDWHGHRCHELHVWPITRSEWANKILWDIGRELLPATRWDKDTENSP